MTEPTSVRRLLRTARPEAPRLGLAILAGSAAAGCSVGLMATAAWLISRAAQHPPVLYLMVAIVAVRFFGIARAVFRYAERLAGHDAALRVLTDLRSRCFDRLATTGVGGLRSGDLVNRLVRDVDSVVDLLVRAVLPVGTGIVVGAGTVALVWGMLPAAGVSLLAGLLLLVGVVPWIQVRAARRAEGRLAPLRGELAAGTVDLLTGLDELTVYGATGDRLAALRGIDTELARAEADSGAALGVGRGLTSLLAGAAALAGLLTGVPAVRSGALDPVLLAVVVLTPLALFEVLADLPSAAQQLPGIRAAATRVFAVLDEPAPVTEPPRPRPLPRPPYALSLRDVTVTWPGSTEPALAGIDLDLGPGRRIAVVGPSGAGKTTLAAVLLRLVDYRGRVTLNDEDLAGLAGDDVRTVVGLCAADAHLFDTTLAANLALARPDATGAERWDALRRAGLADWVSSLPAGLLTRVGEHGERLSGGQRRRLALARALLADVPVLVLDEPTEHVDEAAADALTAELLHAAGDRTTLLITHRLTGLEDVDEIVVLDRGRIVQRGRHAELIGLPGRYRSMWRPRPSLTA
jgi:thiol reductant ABC exporter CydC subunit